MTYLFTANWQKNQMLIVCNIGKGAGTAAFWRTVRLCLYKSNTHVHLEPPGPSVREVLIHLHKEGKCPSVGTQYISKLEFQSTMKIKNMYVRKFSKNIANWEKKKPS